MKKSALVLYLAGMFGLSIFLLLKDAGHIKWLPDDNPFRPLDATPVLLTPTLLSNKDINEIWQHSIFSSSRTETFVASRKMNTVGSLTLTGIYKVGTNAWAQFRAADGKYVIRRLQAPLEDGWKISNISFNAVTITRDDIKVSLFLKQTTPLVTGKKPRSI